MKKKLEKIALQIPQKIFVDLQDVLKMSSKHVLRTSWRYLQRNNFSSCKYIFKTSWMHLQDMSFEYILKKSWKTRNCSVEDFFKTSWRHLQDVSRNRVSDVLKTNKMFTGKESISVSNKSGSAKRYKISPTSFKISGDCLVL